MKIVNKLPGYKALVYVNDHIFLAKKNVIYTASLELDDVKHFATLGHSSLINKIILSSRLLQRFLRYEVGPAVYIENEGIILVFFGTRLYSISLNGGAVEEEKFPFQIKKRPLQLFLSKIEDGTVYFGEYTSNFSYNPVSIFKRDAFKRWNIVFTFSSGEINHIHGIYESIGDERYFILTGDFKQGAGIWCADKNFQKVEAIVRGVQDARVCWLQEWGGKIYTATDRQDDINYFCEVDKTGIKRLFPIVGSSIYSQQNLSNSDTIIFSTAVEPDSSNNFNFTKFITLKKGAGILSSSSCIYAGNPNKGFKIVFAREKDALPFGLFQFGNILFPSGNSKGQIIHFYCVGLKGSDDATFAIDIF